MKIIQHSIETFIVSDLEKKMVFISGPRQIGKTTLAKNIIKKFKGVYLLYDNPEDRRKILDRHFEGSPLICLDEFHKYNKWKDFLKGEYDKHKESLNFLITGSARLDIYQQTGDSLFGRFYLHHLHPLSIAELNKQPIVFDKRKFLEAHAPMEGLDDLLRLSGFPEPFLSGQVREFRRWSNQRRDLLIREDLPQLTQIQLLGIAEKVMLLLPPKIGSLFSYTSLAQDVQVSVQTIQKWLYNFERLFIVFKLMPYSKQVSRSINKRPKYYLWNWADIEDEGARFENLVASHLYKAAQTWTSLGYGDIALHFIQDRMNKEVDFILTENGRPWLLIETKLSDNNISNNLIFYSNKMGIPGIQLVKKRGVSRRVQDTIFCISADRWLGHLV